MILEAIACGLAFAYAYSFSLAILLYREPNTDDEGQRAPNPPSLGSRLRAERRRQLEEQEAARGQEGYTHSLYN